MPGDRHPRATAGAVDPVQVAVAEAAVVNAHGDIDIAQVTALDRDPSQRGGTVGTLLRGATCVCTAISWRGGPLADWLSLVAG